MVETVGVGQDEVEIARAADTTVVVGIPNQGDDIQAIKAGILEIADILVVNKADLSGADRLVADLQMMLQIGAPREWSPPIQETVATDGHGVADLVDTYRRAPRLPGERSDAWHVRREPTARAVRCGLSSKIASRDA